MIRKYLRYRGFALLLWLVAEMLISAVALLAGLASEYVLYTVLISSFTILCICTVDFFTFHRKLKTLCDIRENLSDTLHHLPDPGNAVSAEYTEIIKSLYELLRREHDAHSENLNAQIDYYTAWLHQIKTPIAAIRLAVDTQNADPILTAELFKIERYVDMALQYAKFGRLESDLVLAPCNLDALVLSCIKKYSTLFIQKNLTVVFEKTGLTVVTDEKWLAFILEQILSNAVKYTEEGGVRICTEHRALIVEDTGIGIRSDDIDRIFEKGYTGYNGRYDRRASGLGLFMAKTIANELNLTLSAERFRENGAKLMIGLEKVLKED
ncbi:MAG TPA: sensor histidine kinase [Oscillospiraceae bacterium]|nr:sensor histidine kinase [Oscillospiraceae bacterium]HPF55165.1 sensor histidine kinase [Clostridiales bacterium]HPK34596.1 sensor histidine kinase [Oscillospiraceae bacterium]HPR75940.1 sensor histidine kinase [Oscillospiraceae bacterium]